MLTLGPGRQQWLSVQFLTSYLPYQVVSVSQGRQDCSLTPANRTFQLIPLQCPDLPVLSQHHSVFEPAPRFNVRWNNF